MVPVQAQSSKFEIAVDAKKDVLTTPEEMRPIAVHVDEISFDVNLQHMYRKRVAVIDLELTYPLIEQMIKQLQKRMADKEKGAIRVRFKGRMVLE